MKSLGFDRAGGGMFGEVGGGIHEALGAFEDPHDVRNFQEAYLSQPFAQSCWALVLRIEWCQVSAYNSNNHLAPRCGSHNSWLMSHWNYGCQFNIGACCPKNSIHGSDMRIVNPARQKPWWMTTSHNSSKSRSS